MPDTMTRDEPTVLAPSDADPVLSALQTAEALYLDARSQWDQLAAELKEARLQVEHLQRLHDRLADDVRRQEAQLQEERARAERQRRRANQLAAGLKAVHRAIITGNVYEMILRLCLTVTGATRGVY